MVTWLKPFLAPLYSWSAGFDGGTVATAPKLVRVVLVFMISCRRPAVASTEMFRTDAKCESSKIVLGGHEVSGKRWFCMVVTATDLPICFSRTMASFSGLRHLQNSWAHWWHYLECLVATSMLKGRLQGGDRQLVQRIDGGEGFYYKVAVVSLPHATF